MQRKSSENDKAPPGSTVPSETPAGSIITLDCVRIGMTLGTVHSVTVVSICMIGPITRLVGSRRGISKGRRSKDGDGYLIRTLPLKRTWMRHWNQYKNLNLIVSVRNVKRSSKVLSKSSVDISSAVRVQLWWTGVWYAKRRSVELWTMRRKKCKRWRKLMRS